jgi:hypothetical protein
MNLIVIFYINPFNNLKFFEIFYLFLEKNTKFNIFLSKRESNKIFLYFLI